MKRSTSTSTKILLSALPMLLFFQNALAGKSKYDDVTVSSTYAYGAKYRARFGAGDTQQIGCITGISGSPNSDFVSCYAKAPSGASFYCYTTGTSAQNFMSALETASDHSFLSITKNSDGTCKSLSIENSSLYY